MDAPIPPNEQERLATLRELAILDTPTEQIYDDVVHLAATICDTPIAVINFIDQGRQWGKALVGLEDSEAPREVSFCARTIVQEDGLLVVEDTRADPQWAENPMVAGDPGLTFYAGAAIVTDEGQAVGSVCVADTRGPRELSEQATEALRVLARQTAAHLKLRRLSKELARANVELRRLSIKDSLTGLANRAFLEEAIALALRKRTRTGNDLGMLFCDLDGFKLVNDKLGHHAGDELLMLVAERLSDTARSSDLVARYAGDEFVILCPELQEAPSVLPAVAERLAEAVGEPATIAGTELRPRISVGTALARDADGVEDLLRRADVAMYEAKRAAKRAAVRVPAS
ncbi:MAG TPA: sensor domain-containing diguanylate cyclase [Solirubrobacteraceae bacterium]|nr:sensor domain-containing diguanylate cyclase [Solirubrobacteraceae bacterium]